MRLIFPLLTLLATGCVSTHEASQSYSHEATSFHAIATSGIHTHDLEPRQQRNTQGGTRAQFIDDGCVLEFYTLRPHAEPSSGSDHTHPAGWNNVETAAGYLGTYRRFLTRTRFEQGKAELTQEQKDELRRFASHWLDNAFAPRILVVGHTSADGSQPMNQRLSERRAANTAAHLVTLGVPVEHIRSLGMGEFVPSSLASTSPLRQANRRIELVTYIDESDTAAPVEQCQPALVTIDGEAWGKRLIGTQISSANRGSQS
ncbi:OmpA family protein [Marinobacter fonticola]|uniref:OmpA family protein n=1 Tax=Marinobacter fonticola TaxID=2603215 RepID=UPI0011E7F656|nr:OmpA family protein [Marinobacter fonticola]